MAKLYPPNLEGKLPAFTGTTLVVPFSMNRAVGPSEVYALQVIIRLINRDTVIWTGTDVTHDCYSTTPFARFDLTTAVLDGKFTVGQYYRVQLAYIDITGNHDIGYYSSVGVIKYTTVPTITINDLNDQYSNSHIYDYTGIYKQDPKNGDPTEKLYSSHLKLWNTNGTVVYESPERIHSAQNDALSYEAVESFSIPYDLETGNTYKICFYVTTVNGVSAHSPMYRLSGGGSTGVSYDEVRNLILTAESNYERGTVDLRITHRSPKVKTLKGMFYISRTEDKKPREWQYIRTIFFENSFLNKITICDYTVEQGKTYIYALQQYNNYNLYSERIYSNSVFADFEDYYITDQTRQLRIRFNPKISSMKNTIVESKTNTIGSRYPYIVRSGIVNYKEFQLSGLVSYHMDDDQDFVKWEDLGLQLLDYNRTQTGEENEISNEFLPTYNLTAANISAEREFKLEVLDWLNNGKPKVLKTPAEGNYLVILMNVNMTPMDQIGRMLHTFTCSASEIGPYDYDTLLSYNFYDLTERNVKLIVPQWKTINFSDINLQTGAVSFITGGQSYTGVIPGTDTPNAVFRDQFNNIEYRNILNGDVTTLIDIKDMIPNTPIYIGSEKVIIGATGAYHAELTEGVRVIALPTYYQGGGSLVFQTSGPLLTDFDIIHGYSESYVCGRQFIGGSYSDNLLDQISNVRTKIVMLLQIRLFKREVIDIYADYSQSDNGIPMPSQPMYYDAYGETLMPKDGNVERSISYDFNNSTSLFKIHWLNYTIDEETGERIYYNMRDVAWPVYHDDGSVSEQSEMYYFYTKREKQPNGAIIDVVHQFPVYSSYYYNPSTGEIIEDDFDLYTARFGFQKDDTNKISYEEVNIEEKERITYDSSIQPIVINLHDGIIADLTYIEQVILYSYEEDQYLDVLSASNTYKAMYNNYMEYVTTFDDNETFTIVDDNNTSVQKTYKQCEKSPLEQYRWRIQRELNTQKKLKELKYQYNVLIQKLHSAITNDLTRG